MTDEPTLGEAMRRLDSVTRQLEALAKSMAEDRRDFASTYVRYDVYTARHGHLESRVKDLETDAELKEKTAAETRRQFVFLVLSIAIPAIIGLLLGIASITGAPGT